MPCHDWSSWHTACDFTCQALPLFIVKHWKVGNGPGDKDRDVASWMPCNLTCMPHVMLYPIYATLYHLHYDSVSVSRFPSIFSTRWSRFLNEHCPYKGKLLLITYDMPNYPQPPPLSCPQAHFQLSMSYCVKLGMGMGTRYMPYTPCSYWFHVYVRVFLIWAAVHEGKSQVKSLHIICTLPTHTHYDYHYHFLIILAV